jgi:thioredoxin-like negative regulator of GroEL
MNNVRGVRVMWCSIMRTSLALFALALGTAFFVSLCAAQAPAQSAAAKECFRLHAQPVDQIHFGQHERVYKQWVNVCRQAAAAEPDNIQIRHILARSLMATGQREEAIPLWRDLAAQHNDAGAALRRELQSPP